MAVINQYRGVGVKKRANRASTFFVGVTQDPNEITDSLAADGRQDYLLTEAGYESAKTRKPVKLKQADQPDACRGTSPDDLKIARGLPPNY